MSTLVPPSASGRPHAPFDPLTVEELAAAVDAVRADGRLGPATRFWGVTLDEEHARSAADGSRRARTVFWAFLRPSSRIRSSPTVKLPRSFTASKSSTRSPVPSAA